jgi:hypothetical protein
MQGELMVAARAVWLALGSALVCSTACRASLGLDDYAFAAADGDAGAEPEQGIGPQTPGSGDSPANPATERADGSSVPAGAGGAAGAGNESGPTPGAAGSGTVGSAGAAGEDGAAGAGGTAGSGADADPLDQPLELLGVEPLDAATAEPDSSIRFTLSKPIEPSSAGDRVRLVDRLGRAVPGITSVTGATILFTPSQPLLLANAYTASLLAGVLATDGGALAVPFESHFTIRDGTWSAPENVASVGNSPNVAFDGAGNALLLWQEQRGGCTPSAARFVPGIGWSQLGSVAPDGFGPFCAPLAAAADSDGTFLFAWDALDVTNALDYRADRGFGTPRPSTDYSGNADVTVAAGHGWFVANDINGGLQAAEYNTASGWSATRQLYPLPGEPIGGLDAQLGSGPILALAPSGNARVFWSMLADAETRGVYFASYAEGTDWGRAQVAATYGIATSEIVGLHASASGSGEMLAIWEYHQQSAGVIDFAGIDGADVAADGTATSFGRLVRLSGYSMEPSAALGAQEDGVVTWLQSDGLPADDTLPRVWAAFRASASAGWSAPQPLSSGGQIRARSPRVVLDGSGNGWVTWVEATATDSAQVYGARWRGGGNAFGTPVPISGNTPVSPAPTVVAMNSDTSPTLAIDARGRALAVWVGPAGGVWVARFE